MTMVDTRRVRLLLDVPAGEGPVLYWMQRGQRVNDNWALLYAAERARERNVPLLVVFNMVPQFLLAPRRAYDFLVQGLKEVEASLSAVGIPFLVTTGEPLDTIPALIQERAVGEVVVDFNPLRVPRVWHESVVEKLSIRVAQVDEHNIVPCWVASPKEEFAAYTFRPKVHRLLNEFLTPYPTLTSIYEATPCTPRTDWDAVWASLRINHAIAPVTWLQPGEAAANAMVVDFIEHRLPHYHERRNDPNQDGQSNLSPYLHYGHISSQTVALHVQNVTGIAGAAKEAFLEELIVRRELADNYCFYNAQYDTIAGSHAWAQATIAAHAGDAREYMYTKEEFETAQTHDELWNAMQRQMVTTGKMHGWCRMYWAKKILEWTPDVQTAITIALELNDSYELDGRDPNGVVGVMWSICGVHDRAWTERPIFGKIRYMNYNGAKRKFDVAAYIDEYSAISLFNDKAG